jgi:hypothetical protein
MRPEPRLHAERADPLELRRRVSTRLTVDGARAIDETPIALVAVPGEPLGAGLPADAGGTGRAGDRPAAGHAIHEEAAALGRQTGTRMSHEGPFFDCGLQHQQPNDRGPQPVNNLIGNYS